MSKVTKEQALEALDSLDDFARMGTGVDAIGPRETLRQFIEDAAPMVVSEEDARFRAACKVVRWIEEGRQAYRDGKPLADMRNESQRIGWQEAEYSASASL